MACFIESWGLRGSVSFFSLHLPLHSSFFALSLQLSRNNSIGKFSQPVYCTTAAACYVACSDHYTFLGNYPPTPPLNQHQHLLLTKGKMLAQGRGRQKHIMIRLFWALRKWGRRKSERHAKTWRGRRCLFFSCSFSIQPARQYRSLEKATCYNLVPTSIFPGFGSGRPTSKAREKRPWDEVVLAMQAMSRQLQIGGEGEGGYSTNIWIQMRH